MRTAPFICIKWPGLYRDRTAQCMGYLSNRQCLPHPLRILAQFHTRRIAYLAHLSMHRTAVVGLLTADASARGEISEVVHHSAAVANSAAGGMVGISFASKVSSITMLAASSALKSTPTIGSKRLCMGRTSGEVARTFSIIVFASSEEEWRKTPPASTRAKAVPSSPTRRAATCA